MYTPIVGSNFYNILALYPYDARLNQNLYVNNFFINLLKINNKNMTKFRYNTLGVVP